jgi:hypothetical protein
MSVVEGLIVWPGCRTLHEKVGDILTPEQYKEVSPPATPLLHTVFKSYEG